MDSVSILGEQVIWAKEAPNSLAVTHGVGPFKVVGVDFGISKDQPPLDIIVPSGSRVTVQWDWVKQV